MRDVVMKPTAGGSNTVYACSDTQFWVSTDFGNTWTVKAAAQGLSSPDGGAFGSLRIGVSKNNDNVVYVLAYQNTTRTFAGLFRSTDSGNNFTLQSDAANPPTAAQPNILAYNPTGAESGSQGGYNLCITVHPNVPCIPMMPILFTSEVTVYGKARMPVFPGPIVPAGIAAEQMDYTQIFTICFSPLITQHLINCMCAAMEEWPERKTTTITTGKSAVTV
jgi:hypothetical protein